MSPSILDCDNLKYSILKIDFLYDKIVVEQIFLECTLYGTIVYVFILSL